jgi:transcriptional regulator with XRE-family HTH domain
MNIGKKVNERRKEIGLSLRELGELSGLTAGFLSQIENDQVSPSLNSLQSIAAALKVPMFYLINNTPSGLVVKANERSKVFFPDSQMGYDLLTPDFSRQMMAIIIRMNPFTKRIAMPLAKSTEQWMHILTGCMQIKIGDEAFTLEPGDTIYYDGDSLVEFGSISEDELVVICSITPPVF